MNLTNKTLLAALSLSLLMPFTSNCSSLLKAKKEADKKHEEALFGDRSWGTYLHNAAVNKYTAGIVGLGATGAAVYYGYKHGNPFTDGNFGKRSWDASKSVAGYAKDCVVSPKATAQGAYSTTKAALVTTLTGAKAAPEVAYNKTKAGISATWNGVKAAPVAVWNGTKTAGNYVKSPFVWGYNKLFGKQLTGVQVLSNIGPDANKVNRNVRMVNLANYFNAVETK